MPVLRGQCVGLSGHRRGAKLAADWGCAFAALAAARLVRNWMNKRVVMRVVEGAWQHVPEQTTQLWELCGCTLVATVWCPPYLPW